MYVGIDSDFRFRFLAAGAAVLLHLAAANLLIRTPSPSERARAAGEPKGALVVTGIYAPSAAVTGAVAPDDQPIELARFSASSHVSVPQVDWPETPPSDEWLPAESTALVAPRPLSLDEQREAYLAHLAAIINRAWVRPAAPVTTHGCSARVMLDVKGVVQLVELSGCPSQPQLVMSLVDTFESVSPLPEPSLPEIVAPIIDVTFDTPPAVRIAAAPSE